MILTGKVKFTGRYGDLISYKRNGKHCLRSMPQEVKQSAATKEAALRFGEASRTGKIIRDTFEPFLYGKPDGGFVNRLNKRLIERGVESLRGYRFNQQSSIGQFMSSPILGDDNKLRITNIIQTRHHPKKVTHIEIKLIAIRLDLTTGRVTNSMIRSYRHKFVAWAEDLQPIEWDVNLSGKGTLIVALQANPYQDDYPLYDKRYHATDIIKVEMPVATTLSKKQRRQDRLQLQQKELLQHQQHVAQHWLHYGDNKWQEPTPDSISTTGNDSSQNYRLKEQRE